MNYYVRYFDDEAFVSSMKEAFDFLGGLPDVELDDDCLAQVEEYFTTDQKGMHKFFMPNHKTFVVIKTTASSLEEFKKNNQKNEDSGKTQPQKALDLEQIGWYDCSMTISRMLTNPETGKSFYYLDTMKAKVHANTPHEAYNKMVKHVHDNPEIDSRSQIPAAANKNFQYTFIGEQI